MRLQFVFNSCFFVCFFFLWWFLGAVKLRLEQEGETQLRSKCGSLHTQVQPGEALVQSAHHRFLTSHSRAELTENKKKKILKDLWWLDVQENGETTTAFLILKVASHRPSSPHWRLSFSICSSWQKKKTSHLINFPSVLTPHQLAQAKHALRKPDLVVFTGFGLCALHFLMSARANATCPLVPNDVINRKLWVLMCRGSLVLLSFSSVLPVFFLFFF